MKELPFLFSKRPEPLTQRHPVTSHKTLLLRTVSYDCISKALGHCSVDARGTLADDQRYVAYVASADLAD